MKVLLYAMGVNSAERFELDAGVYSIGRTEGDIRLTDVGCSKRHAVLRVSALGNVYIVDQRTTNGTYVNGVSVSLCKLKEGDEIKIGESVIRFSIIASGNDRVIHHWPELMQCCPKTYQAALLSGSELSGLVTADDR